MIQQKAKVLGVVILVPGNDVEDHTPEDLDCVYPWQPECSGNGCQRQLKTDPLIGNIANLKLTHPWRLSVG